MRARNQTTKRVGYTQGITSSNDRGCLADTRSRGFAPCLSDTGTLLAKIQLS
jgi:hypothetical protein